MSFKRRPDEVRAPDTGEMILILTPDDKAALMGHPFCAVDHSPRPLADPAASRRAARIARRGRGLAAILAGE